jgi:hypothetical protein
MWMGRPCKPFARKKWSWSWGVFRSLGLSCSFAGIQCVRCYAHTLRTRFFFVLMHKHEKHEKHKENQAQRKIVCEACAHNISHMCAYLACLTSHEHAFSSASMKNTRKINQCTTYVALAASYFEGWARWASVWGHAKNALESKWCEANKIVKACSGILKCSGDHHAHAHAHAILISHQVNGHLAAACMSAHHYIIILCCDLVWL